MLAALVLLEGGTPEQQRALLPEIASGERTFALAVTEEDYGWGPEFIRCPARVNGADFAVSGTKLGDSPPGPDGTAPRERGTGATANERAAQTRR